MSEKCFRCGKDLDQHKKGLGCWNYITKKKRYSFARFFTCSVFRTHPIKIMILVEKTGSMRKYQCPKCKKVIIIDRLGKME